MVLATNRKRNNMLATLSMSFIKPWHTKGLVPGARDIKNIDCNKSDCAISMGNEPDNLANNERIGFLIRSLICV